MICPNCKRDHSIWLDCGKAIVTNDEKEPVLGFPAGSLVGEFVEPQRIDKKSRIGSRFHKVAQK